MGALRKRKTALMLLLEARDPEQRSIETILVEAFRKAGSQRKAAEMLNINPPLYNQWVYRLGLEHQIREPEIA